MKNINSLLWTLLFASVSLFAQLREFEIKEMKPPASMPVFVSYPDNAVLVVFSSIKNLSFTSNVEGIDDYKYEDNRYNIFLKTERQFITVRAAGFIEGKISVPKLAAKQVIYYSVEAKKEDAEQIPVNIVTTPPNAKIYIDENFKGVERTHLLSPGVHRLRLELEGYKTVRADIDVSLKNNLFNYKLEKVEMKQVYIRTNPPEAEIYVNESPRGATPKGIFMYPGTVKLRLSKSGYLDVEQEIEITEDEEQTFTYTLRKNTVTFNVTVLPEDAQLRLNNQPYKAGKLELFPGFYTIEISKTGFLPVKDTVTLAIGNDVSRTFNLSKNVGYLLLTVTPPDAEVMINREMHTGKKRVELGIGSYNIEIRKDGYYPVSDNVTIELGKSVPKEYKLERISGTLQFSVDPPDAKAELYSGTTLVQQWNGLKIIRDLPVGRYDLRVSYSGYQKVTRTVNITENATTPLDVVLPKESSISSNSESESLFKPETKSETENADIMLSGGSKSGGSFSIASLLLPGYGQISKGQKYGLIYSVGAVGGAIYYFLSASDYNDEVENYNRFYADYRNTPTSENKETALASRKKLDESFSAANTAIYILAAAYGINLIDAFFISGASYQKLHLSPYVSGSSYGLQFRMSGW